MAVAPVRGLTCTPHGLMNTYPCFKCLSISQLTAVIALTAYALNHSGDYTLANMIDAGKCFACLSDHQKLEAIAASMVGLAIAYGYFDDGEAVTQAAECLTCLDPSVVKGIVVGEECTLINGQWPNQD